MENKYNKIILVLLILSIVLNIFGFNKIEQIRNDLYYTRNNINSLERSLDSSIGNLQHHIQETLDKGASNVSDFTYEIVGYNDKKVDMLLKVSPKNIGINDIFYFNLIFENGTTKTIDANTNDSLNYVGVTNISIYDSIEVNLVIDDGTVKKVEKLTSIYPPEKILTDGVNTQSSGGSWSHNANSKFIIYNSIFNLEFYNNKFENTSRTISNVTLFVEKNEVIIDTIPMAISNNRFGSNQLIYEAELKDYKLNFEPNDKIEIYTTAKDSRGFTYKAVLERLIINEKNELRPDHDFYPYKVTIE